jgi:hypothetical protein
MQLSPWKYEKLINKKCHVKKSLHYIIITNELKIGLLYNNLYTLYIRPESTMFDFFEELIVVACDNYFRIIVNVHFT